MHAYASWCHVPQDFWEILAHGERLARGDGLLYLGSCAPSCDDASALQHRGVTFLKCASRCTHAFAARAPLVLMPGPGAAPLLLRPF